VKSLADLPLVSLCLGGLGAFAIIVASTLLSSLSFAGFLEYLGKHSIVVYLAFFLPMAISRVILLKFAPFLDIGSVSALVTLSGVIGPVIFYAIIQFIGWGKFLFERPKWASIDK
ncbi:MAG: acyltransferase, partial [Nitratireductor sp.]